MFFFYHFTSPYPKVQQEAASVYASIYSGYQLHSGNAHHLFQKEFKFFRLKPTKISYQRCSSWVTQIISGYLDICELIPAHSANIYNS